MARAPFPTTDQILEYLRDNPGRDGRRGMARAFRLDRRQAARLKKTLDDLVDDGVIEDEHRPRRDSTGRGTKGRDTKRRGTKGRGPGRLPTVCVLEIAGTDSDGDLLAAPIDWSEDTAAPRIYMAAEPRGRRALGPGERVLARLKRQRDGSYTARTMRRLPAAPSSVLGIYETVDGHGRIRPVERRQRDELQVAPEDAKGAAPGDLVRAEVLRGGRLGLGQARVVERLSGAGGSRAISLIAIHAQGLPVDFPADALAQAAAAGAAPLAKRADLRPLPLITIDGADARDFDDAVWAEADTENAGGWHIIVAIADVAHYVRPGDALDRAAYERGNSTYFPDRVVPMLPEDLSNGWCSLKPDEDRPCLACEMWIDADGALRRHRFRRALMRSAARLTYEQVQDAHDGRAAALPDSLAADVLEPLYGAFAALSRGRTARGVLDLDLPERVIVLDADGAVERIAARPRLDSHRLIEEFMITANVAAAETLERRRQPCMYRVHDAPAPDKLEALRTFLASVGLKLARGQTLQPAHFNRILAQAAGGEHQRLVNEVVLRSQSQAEYAPANIGHFGLALRRYAHFTSPIRRYADLLVHRALISGLKLGAGGLGRQSVDFAEAGAHISLTERRSVAAERDAVDRYCALFLSEHVGAVFAGHVSGVTRFGLFVTLEDSGADGLVPMRSLGDDFYVHDERRQRLVGRRHGRTWRLGQRVMVRLAEADAVSGSLLLHIDDADGGGGRH